MSKMKNLVLLCWWIVVVIVGVLSTATTTTTSPSSTPVTVTIYEFPPADFEWLPFHNLSQPYTHKPDEKYKFILQQDTKTNRNNNKHNDEIWCGIEIIFDILPSDRYALFRMSLDLTEYGFDSNFEIGLPYGYVDDSIVKPNMIYSSKGSPFELIWKPGTYNPYGGPGGGFQGRYRKFCTRSVFLPVLRHTFKWHSMTRFISTKHIPFHRADVTYILHTLGIKYFGTCQPRACEVKVKFTEINDNTKHHADFSIGNYGGGNFWSTIPELNESYRGDILFIRIRANPEFKEYYKFTFMYQNYCWCLTET
jgi:hypothetical protein